MSHAIKVQSAHGLWGKPFLCLWTSSMHLGTSNIYGRYHFTRHRISHSLSTESPGSFYPENWSSSTIFSLLTIHSLMFRASREETSSWRGLVQIMALHESLRMRHVILKPAIMGFCGRNRSVISGPWIIRSIDGLPEETFACNGQKQQRSPVATRGLPTV